MAVFSLSNSRPSMPNSAGIPSARRGPLKASVIEIHSGGDILLRGIFRRKSLDEILTTVGGPQFSLKRTLGAFNVTLIGIGAIIGAGIFATVGTAASGTADRAGAGPSLMLS